MPNHSPYFKLNFNQWESSAALRTMQNVLTSSSFESQFCKLGFSKCSYTGMCITVPGVKDLSSKPKTCTPRAHKNTVSCRQTAVWNIIPVHCPHLEGLCKSVVSLMLWLVCREKKKVKCNQIKKQTDLVRRKVFLTMCMCSRSYLKNFFGNSYFTWVDNGILKTQGKCSKIVYVIVFRRAPGHKVWDV